MPARKRRSKPHKANTPKAGTELPRFTTPEEALDRAILDLLRKVPPTWGPLDSDSLSATEQEALKLLTAGGLVERRFSFRLSLIGHPVSIEATITATGEYGLVEAVEPVVKSAWQAWAGAYLEGKAGAEKDKPRFHCEKTGAERARLTQYGEQARRDVEDNNVQRLLDFVHRRESGFIGETVRGEGKAETIRTHAAEVSASPLKVEIVNSGPMAEIAGIMEKGFAAMIQAGAKAVSPPTPSRDLIRTPVAVKDYAVSRHTIARYVREGKLKDYRPAGSPKNATFRLDRAEVAAHWERR